MSYPAHPQTVKSSGQARVSYTFESNHIIPIFKSGDKNYPSNYHTIMIIPLLAKLYGIILEKKMNGWPEMEDV